MKIDNTPTGTARNKKVVSTRKRLRAEMMGGNPRKGKVEGGKAKGGEETNSGKKTSGLDAVVPPDNGPAGDDGVQKGRKKTVAFQGVRSEGKDERTSRGTLERDGFVSAVNTAENVSKINGNEAIKVKNHRTQEKNLEIPTAIPTVKSAENVSKVEGRGEIEEVKVTNQRNQEKKSGTDASVLVVKMAENITKMEVQDEIKGFESGDNPVLKQTSKSASTPTSVPKVQKNILATPAKPSSKFRKRQINKSWLPTHVYHAKRAHMTPPKEPLWRHAIPLTPNDKSYRATHRAASSRGCVVWDTSYMSTIGAEGVEVSLLGLLRGLGVEEGMLEGKIGRKWRAGTRGWEGWINETNEPKSKIARVTIIWDVSCAEGEGGKPKVRKMLIRVHPSAFFQVWKETLQVAKMQCPCVMVEDLRFEIGSIEVIGPGSTEALISALQPVNKVDDGGLEIQPENTPEKIWPCLSEVTNPASLPPNALLNFEINDPRLRHPPRTVRSETSHETLLQTLTTWPLDTNLTSAAIFDRQARLTACRLLPSQKSINRRKGDALPGAYPDARPHDPRIPILLAASRASSRASSPGVQGSQGAWRVLLPWKTVLPVWNTLMHYPLSTGENPRFGCLQEQRQIAFEQGVPWFPGDFPGTRAGWEWELMERDKRKAEWEKRPKGKRVTWESVDLGNGSKGEVGMGWACDWERLFQGLYPGGTVPEIAAETASEAGPKTTPEARTEAAPKADPTTAPASIKTPVAPPIPSSPSLNPEEPQPYQPPPPLNIHHVPHARSKMPRTPTALSTISLTLTSRGNPTACARIYRLPTTNPNLRIAWLSQRQPSTKTPPPSLLPLSLTSTNAKNFQPPQGSSPEQEQEPTSPSHIRLQQLAAELLAPLPLPPSSSFLHPSITHQHQHQHQHLPIPGEEDLIGFVTTGNFDLGQGRPRAIGCVALERVQADAGGEGGKGAGREGGEGGEGGKGTEGTEGTEKLCIVREAGQSIGRLARWEFCGL